jgi:hypothetical protein
MPPRSISSYLMDIYDTRHSLSTDNPERHKKILTHPHRSGASSSEPCCRHCALSRFTRMDLLNAIKVASGTVSLNQKVWLKSLNCLIGDPLVLNQIYIKIFFSEKVYGIQSCPMPITSLNSVLSNCAPDPFQFLNFHLPPSLQAHWSPSGMSCNSTNVIPCIFIEDEWFSPIHAITFAHSKPRAIW